MSDNKKLFDKLKDDILEHLNAEVEKFAGSAAVILERELKTVMSEKYIAGGVKSGAAAYEVKKLAWDYLVRIYVNTPFTQYAEGGIKPHYPPIPQNIQWVRKEGLSMFNPAGRSGPGKRYSKYDEEIITAQKIAGKLFRKGTQGIKFFDITLKQAMPLILAEIKN